MSSPAILVFEKRPRWTPELQRQFLGEDIRVRSCRSTAQLELLLRDGAVDVLLLDLESGPADCLQFLGRCTAKSAAPAVIVCGSPGSAPLEWPVRELGAVAFFPEAVSGEEMAEVCRRQWQ